MVERQSFSPASAQGRWTSSLHHRAPPEPAGHAAPQRHPGPSELPILEPGTDPTEHHWEPREVVAERQWLHCWNNTSDWCTHIFRPLMDHWIPSLQTQFLLSLFASQTPWHLLHHLLHLACTSALWPHLCAPVCRDLFLSFVLMSLCVSLAPYSWCFPAPAVPVITESGPGTSSWTAGLQSRHCFKSHITTWASGQQITYTIDVFAPIYHRKKNTFIYCLQCFFGDFGGGFFWLLVIAHCCWSEVCKALSDSVLFGTPS